MMMARPVMKATHIFDLIQEPGYEHTVQNLGELLKHFSLHLCICVLMATQQQRSMSAEWSHLNRMFARDVVLRTLSLEEAFSRAFLHFTDNQFNILLLAAVVQASAMDVVLAELGVPKLLASLKREEAGRRGDMLLFLVGHAWLTIRKHDVILP